MLITERRKGLLAMAVASSIWGLSPLYYKALDHVPPTEVMAHRILWSFVLFLLLLAVRRRLRRMVSYVWTSARQFGAVALAAALIGTNWYVWIYAVHSDRTTDASLGYFIFPLVAVAIGAAVFKERLSKAQFVAVAIAAAGVLVLTAGLGSAPWISLVLAISFASYGFMKKRCGENPIISVSSEAMLLAPLVLAWLLGVHFLGFRDLNGMTGGYFGKGAFETAMFVFSGTITAGPLILMSYASQRIAYGEVGLVQYLNPSLQFLAAVLVFREPFTVWHGIAFPAIWIALALFTASTLGYGRSLRRPSISSGTESATLK